MRRLCFFGELFGRFRSRFWGNFWAFCVGFDQELALLEGAREFGLGDVILVDFINKVSDVGEELFVSTARAFLLLETTDGLVESFDDAAKPLDLLAQPRCLLAQFVDGGFVAFDLLAR